MFNKLNIKDVIYSRKYMKKNSHNLIVIFNNFKYNY